MLEFDKMFFVVSLPRSGTTSINKMAELCGLSPRHAPCSYFDPYFKRKNYNFFSDTPLYAPSTIDFICNYNHCEMKFIFIEREFDKIFDSWKRVGLYRNYTRMYNDYQSSKELMSKGRLYDFSMYNEAFDNVFLDENSYKKIFQNHKEKIISKIKEYGKELLIYKFEDGWEPFCNFISSEIPNEEIPHLNINKM